MNCPHCQAPMLKMNFYCLTEKHLCSKCGKEITGERAWQDDKWEPLYKIYDRKKAEEEG